MTGGDLTVLFFILLFIAGFILVMRLLGAWMLRINEVINSLDLILRELKVSNAVPQSEANQNSFDDSNIVSGMRDNKMDLLMEIQKMNDHLKAIRGGV